MSDSACNAPLGEASLAHFTPNTTPTCPTCLVQVSPPRINQLAGGGQPVAGQPRLRQEQAQLVSQGGQAAHGVWVAARVAQDRVGSSDGKHGLRPGQLCGRAGGGCRRTYAPAQVPVGWPGGGAPQDLAGVRVAAKPQDGMVQVIPGVEESRGY